MKYSALTPSAIYIGAGIISPYLIDTVTVNGASTGKGRTLEIYPGCRTGITPGNDANTPGAACTKRLLPSRTTRTTNGTGVSAWECPSFIIKSETNFQESDTSSNTSNHFRQFEYNDDFHSGTWFNLNRHHLPAPGTHTPGLAIHHQQHT